MKTAIIVTQWLGTKDYINKSIKFYKYYLNPEVQKELGEPDIWVVDNASPIEKVWDMPFHHEKMQLKHYTKHYTRTAHLEYPYCWRALYFARELFQEYDYEKVIFLNNDSYIISKKLMNFIRDFKSGYWHPWCAKHGFPECEIQVFTKNDPSYWLMTALPYLSYNGKQMEDIIPQKSDKSWIGDRHSEYGLLVQDPSWDFSAQVKLQTEIKLV